MSVRSTDGCYQGGSWMPVSRAMDIGCPSPPYHHAAFHVIDEGDRSRLVWLTDVLPHTLASAVQPRVERGIAEIKRTLESTDTE